MQQQVVQNPGIKINTDKDNYIELNKELSITTCDHCHPKDYPMTLALDDYVEYHKRLYVLTPITRSNIEEIKALSNGKKAVKLIDKLITVSNKPLDDKVFFSSLCRLGILYIFLAKGEIKPIDRKTVKLLAPKVISVLIAGLKSDNRELKDQSITFLYYIAQINSQTQLFDVFVKNNLLLAIKQNIFQAKSLYLGVKFQQTYDEFLK
jgi:hypothetical protein